MTYHARNGFLTAYGLAEAAQREGDLDLLDGMGLIHYIDKVGSVSGLELERDLFVHNDAYIDQQYRRFHSGS